MALPGAASPPQPPVSRASAQIVAPSLSQRPFDAPICPRFGTEETEKPPWGSAASSRSTSASSESSAKLYSAVDSRNGQQSRRELWQQPQQTQQQRQQHQFRQQPPREKDLQKQLVSKHDVEKGSNIEWCDYAMGKFCSCGVFEEAREETCCYGVIFSSPEGEGIWPNFEQKHGRPPSKTSWSPLVGAAAAEAAAVVHAPAIAVGEGEGEITPTAADATVSLSAIAAPAASQTTHALQASLTVSPPRA